jgi:hypothetical protein
VKLRTRLAAVLAMLLFVLGVGAGVATQADADTHTNACIVVPPLQFAVCLARF